MEKDLTIVETATSTTQRAYETLRQQILKGALQPGERLKVETLKELLGTGASPVREALSLLTSDQLVERFDQRGFRVAQTSRAQFQEILNLRCKFEDLALRQSIELGEKEWEENLILSHHYLARTDRADTETFEKRHKIYHMTLIGACDSPILLRFCSQLYDLNVRYRHLAGSARSYGVRDVNAEHAAIVDATMDRDAELASQQLTDHYRQTGAFLAEMID